MDDNDCTMSPEEKLYEQLFESPVVNLAGVVSSIGMSARVYPDQDLYSFSFSFDVWRIDGRPIRTETLDIRRIVKEIELPELEASIVDETVVRIRARLAEHNVFGSAQAYLEEYEGLADDPELQAHLLELQKSKTFEDERFGKFSFHRRLGLYSTRIEWCGEMINLYLLAEEPDEIDSCLKIARGLWMEEFLWKTRIEDFAADKLLLIKNDNWLDEDESELSSTEFKNKMNLQSLLIYPGGEFSFNHDDGDLFWGHSIQVCGNVADGLTFSGIAG
jgi:hypothetical protein